MLNGSWHLRNENLSSGRSFYVKGSSGRGRTAPSATGVLRKTSRVIDEGWLVCGGRRVRGRCFIFFFPFHLLPKANIKRLHSPNGKPRPYCWVPGHGAFEYLQEDMHKGLSIKFATHLGCRFGVPLYQIMAFIFYLLVQVPLDRRSSGLVVVDRTSQCALHLGMIMCYVDFVNL